MCMFYGIMFEMVDEEVSPSLFLMQNLDNSKLRFPREPILSHQLTVRDEQRLDDILKLYLVHKFISNISNLANNAMSDSKCNKTET